MTDEPDQRSAPLGAHVRPTAFACAELFLDLINSAQVHFKLDLESLFILMCLNEATMREFVLDPQTPEEIMRAPKPPEHVRGALSRRMIADKTGLPRETVRRRIAELTEAGWVLVTEDGRVRATPRLNEPELQHAVEAGRRAVVRFTQRLEAFGVDWRKPL